MFHYRYSIAMLNCFKEKPNLCTVPTFIFLLQTWNCHPPIDGLEQDCSNSIANALELLQSCTKPSIWTIPTGHVTEWPLLGLLPWYPIAHVKSLQLIWRLGTGRWNLLVSDLQMNFSNLTKWMLSVWQPQLMAASMTCPITLESWGHFQRKDVKMLFNHYRTSHRKDKI